MKKRTIALIALVGMRLAAMGGTDAATSGTGGSGGGWNPVTALANDGVTFPISYTGEVLGNVTGGLRQGAIYDGLLKAGVTMDLSKVMNWQGATLTVDGMYPHGSSLTRNDVRDFNVISNIDTVHSPRLYEAWLEQDLGSPRFSIRAGQVPIDTEFFVSTNGALFINSAFGAIPSIGQNLNVAVYPIAAPGVRLSGTLNDNWNVLAGVFDGSDGNLHSTDRNGLRYNLNGRDGAFAIGELAYALNPAPAAQPDGKQTQATERALSGTYKLGVFYDTGKFADAAKGVEYQGDYGAYFIVDQELWHVPANPDEGLRGFLRLSGAPEDRNTVEFYCDGGFNYAGLVPGRKQDLLGLGVSYTKLSGDLRDSAGDGYPNHYETILELTYQAVVNGWMNVQPDIQYIFNPGGLGTQADALVLGMRVNLTF